MLNKYENWYNSIINRAKSRVLNGFGERHHIIPKSLGGSDKRDNIVKLTAREHFICHWLLIKFKKGKEQYSMFCAFARFGTNGRFNSKEYEIKKKAQSKKTSERNSGNGNPNFGGVFTSKAEIRDKMKKPRINKEFIGKHERTPEMISRFKESRAKGTAGKGEFNSMAKEENRRKVAESKIGKRKFWNPERTESKMLLPENVPEGWVR